ncbi:MAG TPA: Lpg1974 family pore-forming outer membrane protein [Gammaproteobacteria bacterium]|nr:Lpg1974 family pore-forming outer membrane protein [Gammaproteobacteria bacterium]
MCVSNAANAVNFFADALYWQATETIEWCYNNSLSTPNQIIEYHTMQFNFDPGFRVGVGFDGTFDIKFYYTRFYTKSNATASGNLVSTYLGGKLAQSSTFFHSGQLAATINFNMFDLDLSKGFTVANSLVLRPVIGLRGGWIDQSVDTSFRGSTSISEYVTNNFRGIGPKAAIETQWWLKRTKNSRWNIFADFTGSYLWGYWQITDVTYQSTGAQVHINSGNRTFGAITLQALVGLEFAYKCLDVQLGYEIVDWFNQFQVLDDGTGAHDNDLILQGLTLQLAYRF